MQQTSFQVFKVFSPVFVFLSFFFYTVWQQSVHFPHLRSWAWKQQVESSGSVIIWHSSLSWIEHCKLHPEVKVRNVDRKHVLLTKKVSFHLWWGTISMPIMSYCGRHIAYTIQFPRPPQFNCKTHSKQNSTGEIRQLRGIAVRLCFTEAPLSQK